MYEDGICALFLPGPEKELFTLKRYQEEIGKDFKRITLFLCTDHDLKKSEGHCESTDSSEEPIFVKTSVPLPAEMPPSSSSGDVEVETTSSKEETEAQFALDQLVASELQELYDVNVDGNDCISNGCVEEKEVDSSSIVKEISKKVDQSHQFFIIARRRHHYKGYLAFGEERQAGTLPLLMDHSESILRGKMELILEHYQKNS